MEESKTSIQVNKTYVDDGFIRKYGSSAATVLRLATACGITGTRRIVIADSWFAGMQSVAGLRDHGLHFIGLLKTSHSGFPKDEMTQLLLEDDKSRGDWCVMRHKMSNGQFIWGGAWRGKSDKLKGKKKRNNFVSPFIFTDCTTSLRGVDARKRRHNPDGTPAPAKWIKRPQFVEDFYTGMPATDISNKDRQSCYSAAEFYKTSNARQKHLYHIVSFWATNAYNSHRTFTPKYIQHRGKNRERRNWLESLILLGLFEQEDPGDCGSMSLQSNASYCSMYSRDATNTSILNREEEYFRGYDCYQHPMMRFSDVTKNICNQQKCVMCLKMKVSRKTIYFCGTCAVFSEEEQERIISKHAYCIDHFSIHVANCQRYAVTFNTHLVPFWAQRQLPMRGQQSVTIDEVRKLMSVINLGMESRTGKGKCKGRKGRVFSKKRRKDVPPCSVDVETSDGAMDQRDLGNYSVCSSLTSGGVSRKMLASIPQGATMSFYNGKGSTKKGHFKKQMLDEKKLKEK